MFVCKSVEISYVKSIVCSNLEGDVNFRALVLRNDPDAPFRTFGKIGNSKVWYIKAVLGACGSIELSNLDSDVDFGALVCPNDKSGTLSLQGSAVRYKWKSG